MTNIEQQHEVVKESLFKFVNQHIPGADLSVVDEIVLSYIISILEEASQDPCFDVEGFIEMMTAYFSEFSSIDAATICTWIFQLENQLSNFNKNEEAQNLSLNSHREKRNYATVYKNVLGTKNPFNIPLEQFLQLYKFPQAVVLDMLTELNRTKLEYDNSLPFHIKFLLALRFYGNATYQRNRNSDIFNTINESTAARAVHEITDQIITEWLPKYVRFPTTPMEMSAVKEGNLSLSDIIPEIKLRGRPPSISEITNDVTTTTTTTAPTQKRVQHLSETSDGGSTDSSNCDFFSEECDVLQEMFPESSFLEVKHCITIANGDIDRATQILLHRQETGQSLSGNAGQIQGHKNNAIDDAELKNRIIARYSYVDKNAANREYKPVVPKVEPKKLVRYRDNKIVSLKGERYTEVGKRDDEAELKKPKKSICP